jgi:ATP synthase protein I
MGGERPRLDMNAMRQGLTIGSVGLEMGISVVIGVTVGYYLDKWLDTKPLMTILWTLFGLGAAAKALLMAYKQAKKVGQEPDGGP